MTGETQPTIDGLELPQLTAAPSALAESVDQTLRQLVDDEHLDPVRDAARIALARELAAVIAHKRSSGRASTVGQDAKVLLDLLDGMVPTEAATSEATQLRQAMEAWSAQVNQLLANQATGPQAVAG